MNTPLTLTAHSCVFTHATATWNLPLFTGTRKLQRWESHRYQRVQNSSTPGRGSAEEKECGGKKKKNCEIF